MGLSDSALAGWRADVADSLARSAMHSVCVSDTGSGSPADKLETIFDPFVQVNRILSSPDIGVGLELAISRELAHGMGGDLTVSSTPGVGTTFTLTLPAAAESH